MSNLVKNKLQRRIARIRSRICGSAERPRLCVSRSLAHISAQMVDDERGVVLFVVHDREISKKERDRKTKTEIAYLVGRKIADKAKEQNIILAVFDRHGRTYHGRVQAVADGARAGGLEF